MCPESVDRNCQGLTVRCPCHPAEGWIATHTAAFSPENRDAKPVQGAVHAVIMQHRLQHAEEKHDGALWAVKWQC